MGLAEAFIIDGDSVNIALTSAPKEMKSLLPVSLGVLTTPITNAQSESPEPYASDALEPRDARMAWWREARFGMFIH